MRFCRHFNCPSGLDERTTVDLVVDSHAEATVVYLNGTRLGEAGKSAEPARFAVDLLLKSHNEIWVDILSSGPSDQDSVGLPFEVHLELGEKKGHE